MSEPTLILMACPSCGYIADIEQSQVRYCIQCRLRDVHHRMMTVPELLLMGARAFRAGKEQTASRAQGVAINLVRYTTILECLAVAGDAYAESSYAGVDPHGCYHSAMDAISELVKDMTQ